MEKRRDLAATSGPPAWEKLRGYLWGEDISGTQGGVVGSRWDHTPFGRRIGSLTSDGATLCPIGFSSKYEDQETGLVYYGYLALEKGRWLNRDPIGGRGGMNRHSTPSKDDHLRLARQPGVKGYVGSGSGNGLDYEYGPPVSVPGTNPPVQFPRTPLKP